MQIKSMTALALTAAFMAFGSAPASANVNASTDAVAGSSRYEAEPASTRCRCGVRYYRVYRVHRVYRVYRVRYYFI